VPTTREITFIIHCAQKGRTECNRQHSDRAPKRDAYNPAGRQQIWEGREITFIIITCAQEGYRKCSRQHSNSAGYKVNEGAGYKVNEGTGYKIQGKRYKIQGEAEDQGR